MHVPSNSLQVRRMVGMAFVDDSRRILLQHRTDDAPRYPGYWGFFGGHIDAGENPGQAVIREIKEELDIEVPYPSLCLELHEKHSGEWVDFYLFTAQLEHSLAWCKAHQKEGKGIGLFGEHEIAGLTLSSYDREALKKFFSGFPKIL